MLKIIFLNELCQGYSSAAYVPSWQAQVWFLVQKREEEKVRARDGLSVKKALGLISSTSQIKEEWGRDGEWDVAKEKMLWEVEVCFIGTP